MVSAAHDLKPFWDYYAAERGLRPRGQPGPARVAHRLYASPPDTLSRSRNILQTLLLHYRIVLPITHFSLDWQDGP